MAHPAPSCRLLCIHSILGLEMSSFLLCFLLRLTANFHGNGILYSSLIVEKHHLTLWKSNFYEQSWADEIPAVDAQNVAFDRVSR